MKADETRAPVGRGGRSRRRGAGSYRGLMVRLPESLHKLLEDEARSTGESKVALIEQALAARYGSP